MAKSRPRKNDNARIYIKTAFPYNKFGIYLCLPVEKGNYQILGRTVYMDFVEEHLRTKKNINIGDNQASANNIQLKILADTVYVKVRIEFSF